LDSVRLVNAEQESFSWPQAFTPAEMKEGEAIA
jgi:hypothetical protein